LAIAKENMKILIFLIWGMVIWTDTTLAQISINLKDCYYDGNDLLLSIDISNKTETVKTIEIDSFNRMLHLSPIKSGQQFKIALHNPYLNNFVLLYFGDSLVDDRDIFSVHCDLMHPYEELTIQAKSKTERKYRIIEMNEDAVKSLQLKGDVYIQVFFLYRFNHSVENVMSQRVKVNYRF
jgi:hypothetical protein